MTWELWACLGVGALVVLYLVARFLYIWYFCGGNDSGNYYRDLEN